MKFDSTYEEIEYRDLLLRQQGGYIKDLECQFEWRLEVGGIEIFKYTIDFVYKERVGPDKWVTVGKECKGYFTDRDRLRFKAFAAHHLKLGWVILLQQSVTQIERSFYPIRLSPKGTIQYLDHQRTWQRWLFTKKSKRKR